MYATGCFLTPSLTNFECLNSTILRGIILQPVAEPETSPEQQIAEFEKSVQAQIKREKERKTFTCPYAGCSFKSKNKYQKVVSSGLNIEKHHLATCDHRPQCLVENDSITAEINEKVSRWKVKKEIMKKEKQKFTCPLIWLWKDLYKQALHWGKKTFSKLPCEESKKTFYILQEEHVRSGFFS